MAPSVAPIPRRSCGLAAQQLMLPGPSAVRSGLALIVRSRRRGQGYMTERHLNAITLTLKVFDGQPFGGRVF